MSIAGSAGSGGYTYQHLTYAYIATHVLVGAPLRWFGSGSALTPVALRAEGAGGGGGDDVHVEVGEGGLTLLVQAKRGLQGGRALRDTTIALLRDIVPRPGGRGVIVFDPTTRSAARDLMMDLERLRCGHSDGLKQATRDLLAECSTEEREAIGRLYLVELHLEGDSGAHHEAAEEKLGRILEQYDQRHAAWSVLGARGAEATRQRSGDSQDSLRTLLLNARIGIQVDAPPTTVTASRGFASLSARPTTVAPSLTAAPWRPDAPHYEVALHTKIDTAKSLLEADAPTAALHLLDEVLAALGALPPVDTVIHLRLHNNRGVAFLSLGQLDEADREFSAALDFAPEDPNATSNRGAVAMRRKEYERALALSREVLVRNPTHGGAWAVRLEAEARLGQPKPPSDEALQLESVRLTLGMLALERRDWDTAEGEAVAALALGNRSASALLEIATARLGRLGAIYEDSPAAREVLEDIARLAREAKTSLGRAEGATSWRLDQAVTLEAIALRLLGKPQQARDLLEHMLHLNLGGQRCTVLLAFIESEEFDNHRRALELLERAAENAPLEPEAEISRARALYLAGRLGEARLAAGAASDGLRQQGDLLIWGGAAAEVAIAVGAIEVARTLLSEPDLLGLPDWLLALLQARLADAEDDNERAERSYLQAIAVAPPTRHADLRRELGAWFHRAAEWKKAAEQYRHAGSEGADDASGVRFAHALLQSRALPELNETLAELKTHGTGELPRWALQFEVQVARLTDDVPRQVIALSAMAALWPERVDVLTSLAGALLRLDRVEEAGDAVRRAEAAVGESADEWTAIARVWGQLDEHERALMAAYRAVRLSGEAADQCGLYLALFVRLEQIKRSSALFVGTKAQPGTVVTLHDIKHERPYTVRLVDDWEREDAETVRAGGPRAALLLGKAVDDEILLEHGSINERRARLVDVKSIYVWQFQRILEGSGHPLAPRGIWRVNLPLEDPAVVADLGEVAAPLAERARMAQRMYEMHRDQLVPLGAIAQIMAVHTADLYNAYTSGGYRLEVETGNPAAYQGAIARLGHGEGVVLARSFLETADRLGLLPLLPTAHAHLVVPRSLCDELNAEIREERDKEAAGGQSTIALVNGAMSVHKSKPEAAHAQAERLARLSSWVEANCEILPRPPEATTAEIEENRHRVGASSVDCVWLATHHGLVLLVDDVGLRLYQFAGAGRADGCSTAPWLRFACAQGHISNDNRSHYIAQLLELRHHFVSVDAEDVIAALRRSAFRMEGDVLVLINTLRDSSVSIESAAHVVAVAARLLAIDSLGDFALKPFLRAALDALADGRTMQELRDPLVGAFASALALLPHALQAAADAMAEVMAARRLAQGI